jgi:SAM-dependent methyltransferase
MLFTTSGLDQATAPAIARYHAALLGHCKLALDAGCGIGSDLREICLRTDVVAVDTSEEAIACARYNLPGSSTNPFPVRFVRADITTISVGAMRQAGVDGLFCDPGRRYEEAGVTRRVRSAEQSNPPLSWLISVATSFPVVLFKLSPAIQDEELQQLGGTSQFLSYRGQCREALALTAQPYGPYSAVKVAEDGSYDELSSVPHALAETRPAGGWLYEPDPAAIRAHLVDTLGVLTKTHRLVDGLAYLTGDDLVHNSWLTPYRVIEPVPCDLRYLRAWQKRTGRRISVVKTRGATPTPEEMLTKLRDAAVNGAKQAVLFLARDRAGVTAVLCEQAS